MDAICKLIPAPPASFERRKAFLSGPSFEHVAPLVVTRCGCQQKASSRTGGNGTEKLCAAVPRFMGFVNRKDFWWLLHSLA